MTDTAHKARGPRSLYESLLSTINKSCYIAFKNQVLTVIQNISHSGNSQENVHG